jgi:hypothetical protein
MSDRDNGLDKTDKREDEQLAKQAKLVQLQMPFFESEPPIYYAPVPTEKE